MPDKIHVYLEAGKKRTFAGALDWPGWVRGGKDEVLAVQALIEYGPRYARAIKSARLGFKPPARAGDLAMVERRAGDASTDFGVPAVAPAYDRKPVDAAELKRLQALLKACWRTFDSIAEAARGKTLRKGPRGGGRELDAIVSHVREAERMYLGQLGGAFQGEVVADPEPLRKEILNALARSARGELPTRGPRGGLRWTASYFVRRAAWHVLDHAWEIEDRVE